MTTPLLLPITRYVAAGWLQLAVPGVGVDIELPEADSTVRQNGFIRTAAAGGSPDVYVPMREPVVQVECWFPPPASGMQASWARAEQLANRVLSATYNGALMGRLIDLSTVGNYAPARVHTVTALSEPDAVEEDASDWSRFDVDLLFRWSPV
ncbi:MAG: hypothetical protein HOQ45_20305 [Nocardioidaceae bacterium]|nr:hypothetical protein [Nocardioidaceae bacterium]